MADETETNGCGTSSKCSVCGETFTSIQECLKHELINHSLQKKFNRNNRIQKRINATIKFLNTDEKKLQHQRLSQQLDNCKSGEELKTILNLFCMQTDNLSLIYTRIQTCLERQLSGIVGIYPFGSIASGLALRDCDIDVYVNVSRKITTPKHEEHEQKENRNYHFIKAYNHINKLLHRSTHFTDVFAIRRARVPIIKCKHNDTGFCIDINVSYPSSRENTQFIHDLVRSDARIHELMLFMKIWAKNSQIIGREVMTSYCLITMVIFFLQQPRKMASASKENSEGGSRILKSMKELQEDCHIHMVQGINYAYDLTSEENKPQIPPDITTFDLINEFFEFYESFNFEDYIVSPYYGKPIAKNNITPEICKEYYKQLKTITQYLQGEPANNLKIDCCMCVQDTFGLNQNTAKNISPLNKQYITLCLQNAKKICENRQNLTLAQLYIQLLFDTIRINPLNVTKVSQAAPDNINSNNDNFSHTIIPSKTDLRTVAAHHPELIKGNEILECWCQHYINAICTILTELYRMDINKQQPTQQKQQKLDEDGNNNLNNLWIISCTIDLWSNRCFKKNSDINFMSYQLQQTERLHNLRRQDPKFSVTLNGILKINILPNNMGIEIKLELPEDAVNASLKKRSPVRKFFNIFKNTLQNFSVKEILNIDNANAKTNDAAHTADTTGTAAANADNS